MSGLLIAGAGGHGRVLADAADLVGGWSRIAFLDDQKPAGSRVDDWLVLGGLESALSWREDYPNIVVAIGNNRVRLEWLSRYEAMGMRIPAVMHPSAQVSPRASVAAGSVVFAGAMINIGARIGRGGIVNTGAVIEHDCHLGAAVHVSPGASLAGEVSVGERSWIGVGASVRQQLSIGNDVIVGAGSAVVADIPDGLTVGGVPARPLQSKRNAE